MPELKDRANELKDAAEDLLRDNLDTFKNLGKEQQILIIAFSVVILLVLFFFLFRPGKLNVVISQIDMHGVENMDNRVVIINGEKKAIKNVKVTLNEQFEYFRDQIESGDTIDISVTDFRPIGNPEGNPPEPDTMIKLVGVKARGGKTIKDFSIKK